MSIIFNLLRKSIIAIKREELAVLALALTIIMMSTHFITVNADSVNKGVYSIDAKPFGIKYGEWTAHWWQWNMGMPSATHLREHFDSKKCNMDQKGPIWFLPDGLNGKELRSCTIPSDKAVLVPALTGNCDDDNPQSPMNDEELLKCASEGGDYSTISATLDGVALKNLNDYKISSPPFNMTVPEDNIFNNKPGTYRTIANGWYVFLEPLSEGAHQLNLTTNVVNPLHPEYNYNSELTYEITVEP